MNNINKLQAIKEWQEADFVHPCTCKVDGQNHRNLIGKEFDNKVVLVCPDCGIIQENVPEEIYKAYENHSLEETKRKLEKFMKGAIV